MTLEQCKYLTEKVLGECWHPEHIKGKLTCILCGEHLFAHSDPNTFGTLRRTFDNWTDFGMLWEAMQKHEKWEEFLRHHSVGGFYYKQIDAHYVHETRFANEVYEFLKVRES